MVTEYLMLFQNNTQLIYYYKKLNFVLSPI